MPPKARLILQLLEDYESPLTADFQSVYHLRLIEAVIERTEQEVFDLILWLPQGSAFRAAHEAQGDDKKMRELYGWTLEHDLMVGNLNALREQTWVLVAAHSSKSKPPRPDPILTPRDAPKKAARGDATAIAMGLLALQRKA